MRFEEFQASLKGASPPETLSGLAQAMWWDGKGDWTRAHEMAQGAETPEAAWVHAYLHRKEGNAENAIYWYQQAGKPHSQLSFDAEWAEISRALLA
jgi:hypothetical protein